MAPTSTLFDQILDELGPNVTQVRGSHAMARCPLDGHANGDLHPGLSITDNEGQLLVYCHGLHGPCYSDLLKEFGMTVKRRKGVRRDEHELVETYEYTDEDDEVLYQVARFHPKTFRQRRPDGDGGWISNLDGVTRVPYRLAEVQAAIAEGDPILFLEGEKDVNYAWALDFPATTTAQGSKSWGAGDYAHWFKGANVIIVPDRDGQGEYFAHEVARDLHRVANAVRIARIPEELGDKADFYDLVMSQDIDDTRVWLNAAETYDPSTARIDESLTVSSAVGRAASVTADDDQIEVTWAEEGLSMTFSDFIYQGAKVTALLQVSLGFHGQIVRAREVSLRSNTYRKDLATDLNRYEKQSKGDTPWQAYIEHAFGVADSYLSSPEEWLDLADTPIDSITSEDWILRDFIPGGVDEEGATVIAADGGSGKSYIAEGIGITVATGKPVFGKMDPQVVGKVLYLDWESGWRKHRRRIERIAQGARIPLDEIKGKFIYSRERTPLINSIRKIKGRIKKQGIRFVIIDSLRGAAKGSLVNDDTIEPFFNAVASLGVPVLIIHHVNRSEGTYYGSAFIRNFARFAWEIEDSAYLERDKDKRTGRKVLLLRCDKDNEYGMEGEKLGMLMEWMPDGEVGMVPKNAGWAAARAANPSAQGSLADRIIDFLEGEGAWYHIDALYASLFPESKDPRRDRKRVRDEVNRLAKNGKIQKQGTASDMMVADLAVKEEEGRWWDPES